MALSIVTKKRFENKVKSVLEYLILNWYDKVADDFILIWDTKMELLSRQPFMGPEAPSNSDVRTYLLTKHNRIYQELAGVKLSLSICLIQGWILKKIPLTNPNEPAFLLP